MRPAMDRTLAMDGLRSVVVIACTAALQSAGTSRTGTEDRAQTGRLRSRNRNSAGRPAKTLANGRVRGNGERSADATRRNRVNNRTVTPPSRRLSPQVAKGRAGAVDSGAHDATRVAGAFADRIQVVETLGHQCVGVTG